MKTQTFLIPLCSLFCALPVMADVFVLKDGSRLEGTILREEGSNYVLEVKVTKSIRDEKIVAKADVVNIESERKDLTAFDSIKKLVPVPDLMGADEYTTRIAAVDSFLKTYPTSTKKAEATKILETLKTESEAVAAGGMKMNGAIVPASAYKANAYDIDAQKQAALVRAAGTRFDYIGALRAFDVMDRDFKESKAYGETIPVVSQILTAYDTQVKTALTTLPAREKEQKAGLERMSPQDKMNAESGLAAQKAEGLARYQKEKADKQNWVTADPSNKLSLDDASRAISSLQSKLIAYKPTGTDAGTAYRNARAALDSRDAKASATAVQAASTARLPARYLAPLTEEVKALQAETVAKAAADKAASIAAEKAAKEEAATKKAAADAAAKAAAEAEKAAKKTPAQ